MAALAAGLEAVLHLTKEENVAKTDALGAEIENADVRGHAVGTREGLDRVTGSVKGTSYEFQSKYIKMLSSEY